MESQWRTIFHPWVTYQYIGCWVVCTSQIKTNYKESLNIARFHQRATWIKRESTCCVCSYRLFICASIIVNLISPIDQIATWNIDKQMIVHLILRNICLWSFFPPSINYFQQHLLFYCEISTQHPNDALYPASWQKYGPGLSLSGVFPHFISHLLQ